MSALTDFQIIKKLGKCHERQSIRYKYQILEWIFMDTVTDLVYLL